MQSLSRRALLKGSGAILSVSAGVAPGLAQAASQSESDDKAKPVSLFDHPARHYRFVPALPAYSAGVVGASGYEIVHATFSKPLGLEAGFRAVDAHLSAQKAPKFALCAVELRSPGALSVEEFGAFNRQYSAQLTGRGLLLENGRNPVARTNVVPALFPPVEPVLHAFSYVVRGRTARPTFIIAGGGELPDGPINPNEIIRRGETSPDAIAEKARYVLSRVTGRLRALGVSWTDVTTLNVYTTQELGRELLAEILKSAGHTALCWNYAHPPIANVELEMDARGVRQEIVLG